MATKAEIVKLREMATLMGIDITGKTYEDLLEEFFTAVEVVPVEKEGDIPNGVVAYYNATAAAMYAAAEAAAAKEAAPPAPIPATPAVVPPAPKPKVEGAAAPRPRKPSAYPLIVASIFGAPTITKAELTKTVSDAGFTVNPSTFDIQFNDVRRIYGIVKELGFLKEQP